MDYGKISYYKIEELERQVIGGRLNASTLRVTDLPAGVTTAVAELRGKGLLVVRVEGSGGTYTAVSSGGEQVGAGYGDFTLAVAAGAGEIAVLPVGGMASVVTVTAAGWGAVLTPAKESNNE